LAMSPQPELGQSRAMITPSAERNLMGFIVSDAKANFLVKRLSYFADCNLLDDIPKVNGFFSLYPRECGQVAGLLYESSAIYPKLADFLSVSQQSASREGYSWTPRNSWLPLVTAGQQPIFIRDEDALWALAKTNFEPSQVV